MSLAGAWRLVTSCAAPLVRGQLERRRARGKEHPERWPERLGIDPSTRPPGRLVWLHAASVGESLSILPLLDALHAARPDLRLLVTTGTVTSAALMAKRLPAGVLHRFAPVDLPDAVDRFLERWRPDLVLFVESELWPNLLFALKEQGIRSVLLNARMSDRSYGRWRRVRPLARRLLGTFDLVLAQSDADAARWRDLGVPEVGTPGNLKFASPPLPADPAALDQLRRAIGTRPAWLAASTHPGEEALVRDAHLAALARHPDLLTIIVPRHPERGAAIVAELAGLPVTRRAAGEGLPEQAGIHIADTLGELGLFYRAVPLVFVGGSLVRHGGQNPLEPARLGRAILLGPHVWNFQEIAAAMLAAGAARPVADPAALAAAVTELLADPVAMRVMGEAARNFADEQAGVLDRTLAAILPLLPAPA